jgi:hypothetical protein
VPKKRLGWSQRQLAPVRNLATLLGADSETARWFVLVVALLLDPAAVLLLLAATGGEATDAGERPGDP